MKQNYKSKNLEITNKWLEDLKKEFIINIPSSINLLEKTKIIKKNILLSLDIAYKLSAISKDKEIFDTTASMQSFEKEIEKIKKDVVSIAVFGQMSSGKSSFLNSLVGEKLLAVAEERATSTITIIRHIDNFDGQIDGNIEIHYKTKNEILLELTKAWEVLNNYFHNVFEVDLFPDNIDDILLKKDEFFNKLASISHKDIDRKNRKFVKVHIDVVNFILKGLKENRDDLGKIVNKNKLDNNNFLTNINLSVFINNVVFYKDIELLKNIELIDTPGLGSSSQLDTRKSEVFIEKADIVMIITDVKEPMQKESELDILYILEDIQKNEGDKNFFDKVFIIVNKIDDTDKNRDEIKDLLNESIDDADIKISDKNLLFVSSLFEYEKRFNKKDLNSLFFKNKNNLGKNDLMIIEKTIYDFSAAEATSKFLTENIKKIDNIFNEADRNFKNNLTRLDGDIGEIEKKINTFKSTKNDIQKELENELKDIVEDKYRELHAFALSYNDDSLKIIANEKYFETKAQENGTFKKSNSDNTSSNYYKDSAKSLMKEIIEENNKELQMIMKKKVFKKEKIDSLKDDLQDRTKEIQKKYENDYGVVLNLEDIEIQPININITRNIDLEIGMLKLIKQFFSIFIWGKEDKYINISAEGWEKYAKEIYTKNLKDEIKNKISDAQNKVKEKTNDAISDIVLTIENQLNQQYSDYKQYAENKEETIRKKEIVQSSFQLLKTNYIAQAKEQNINLFK